MGGVPLLMIYPWLEKRFTGDDAHHNLLQRPRDVPVRTGIGAMTHRVLPGADVQRVNDIIAYTFHISLNATTWIGRIGMLILPPLAFFIAYRWAVGLQRSDRDVLEHGIETGIIKRLPHGAYVEIAPAARSGRRSRPPDSAGVPRRRVAQADEQAGTGRQAWPRQVPDCRSGVRGRRAERGGPRLQAAGAHRPGYRLESPAGTGTGTAIHEPALPVTTRRPRQPGGFLLAGVLSGDAWGLLPRYPTTSLIMR